MIYAGFLLFGLVCGFYIAWVTHSRISLKYGCRKQAHRPMKPTFDDFEVKALQVLFPGMSKAVARERLHGQSLHDVVKAHGRGIHR